MDKETLLAIERGFWFEGAGYYERHISPEAVFMFPGVRLDKEDGVAGADSAKRWRDLDIEDVRLLAIDDGVSLLMYHATSEREGQEPYAGNISTLYRMEDGEPKMIFHQHTPDPSTR